ncbi:Transcriptional regulator GlxA family, contains an amidase domain and an AraC-type DNA-binding HTH domain [Lentzea fradiae]|uniref:Transcriptional regulator GlxA family, contains an amidase domain and an AraC-type DNA-binding HTH domain n=1 Tax=Lentzea fradiae TaxID=200378 RepID=A0A1G8BGK0_9PSEU|nr:DJ-1/PfpI family protein [Lentzea fradiae]SDH32184.1 Transcriptional regulator GlxA family, contains an amidase domain and an AraC-type DNA-binding HTH domain [Lentzea fradiae]
MTGSSRRRHRVAVLALDGVQPMEVGMPFQTFGLHHRHYDVILCGRSAGPVETLNGWSLVAPHGLDEVVKADTVVVPAYRGSERDTPPDATPDVRDALREAHSRGARIATICTGAFALASTGLLDGKRATTHWLLTDELARRHPRIDVDPGVLYVDNGSLLTSAGVASGIDLCLHLLRRDCGAATATSIARGIVAAPHREGGQAQYVTRPPAPPNRIELSATLEWALHRLDTPLAVADLAAHAAVAERTFARMFTAQLGVSPIRWLTAARVSRARELLETTDAGIDHIGRMCGLGSPANFRHHFRVATGTTPTDYRRTFSSRTTSGAAASPDEELAELHPTLRGQ